MPSFPTISCSYNQFFVAIIDNAPYLSGDIPNHTLRKFAILTLTIIVFTLLFATTFFILIYIQYHQNSTWDSAQLYWMYDTFVYIGTAFITFIITSMLITTTINTPIFHFLVINQHKFRIIVFMSTLLIAAIYLFTAYITDYKYVGGSNKSVFSGAETLCNIILCEYWTLKKFLNHIAYVGFLPVIFFISWLVLDALIFCRSQEDTTNTQLYKNFPATRQVSNKDLELGLLQRHSQFERENASYDKLSSLHTRHTSMFERITNKNGVFFGLLFGILFGVLWLFQLFCGRIEKSILKNSTDFEYLYYYVLCYTSFSKFILKRVGRKIDQMRIRNNELNYTLSCEYFMEWYLSIVYFSWFKINVVYNVPPLKFFVVIFFVHLSSEMVQSLTRFSTFYYNSSYKMLLYFKNNSGYNTFYRLIYKVFEDDSDMNEWRNRNALDMILRFYASVVVSIMQAYLMLVIGHNKFENKYQMDSYYTGVYYACFTMAGELFYYGIFWAYYWYSKQYCIFSAFVLLIMGMSKGNKILILLTFFSAIIPSMLQ